MKTRIEWTDWTCNAFWGCDFGCSYCAARRYAHRFGKSIGKSRGYSLVTIRKMMAFSPVFLPDQLDRIPEKPCRVFISFMGDWVASEFDDSARFLMFRTIQSHPGHTFQLLTKQPQNLSKWSPFPDNCWVGVSATKTIEYLNAADRLSNVKATIKFISLEPLLDWDNELFRVISVYQNKPDWLIIGQQTPVSVKTSPKIEWIQEIVEAADKAGIPVFLKDNLKPLLIEQAWNNKSLVIDYTYGESEFEGIVDCKLRQEFPR